MEDAANVVVLAVGAVFHGRYEVARCLSVGGMGMVYEVTDLRTRRRRALKVMRPELVGDPVLRERFAVEATVAAEIDSEHIVETSDAGIDPETGMPFLVMELLKGEDLERRIERGGPLAAREAHALILQAGNALAHEAHERCARQASPQTALPAPSARAGRCPRRGRGSGPAVDLARMVYERPHRKRCRHRAAPANKKPTWRGQDESFCSRRRQ
ncbi:MAG: hypothetical protein IT372_41910, partial [Polyangiaceae bacterium]|nr:hypothetical protein [Polyangiaceae bacterium]